MSEPKPTLGKILVVEDDEHVSYMLNFILQREGYTTEHAADGRVAEQLIASIAPPDLVLLDIMLPYQDGFQLLKNIRTRSAWAKVPVIMLSAKSQEQDIVQALDLGANDYVTKPFQPRELLARIRRSLRDAL
ncbi:MAG: response regulator transcription factor [Pseudomonadota bacterium]